MDMLMVDLDPVPAAGVGSPVSLWGEDGPSVDEVAQAAGTIGYELLCAVARACRSSANPEAATALSRSVFVPRALARGAPWRARAPLWRGVYAGQELLRNLQDSRPRMVSTICKLKTGRSCARFPENRLRGFDP